ncbi:hypothetical protein [Raoultella ornithinolytica]|uniref:hypothetical protein n=1 Tax=Raoultella ornithinolytica TaxID=54291 RepID=UPI0015DC151C|nr:hypothetical protein [Raoultella ornithinolytica]QLK21519.1 hypothetical protein GPJ66_12325 [Raoultella ornithinolytica]
MEESKIRCYGCGGTFTREELQYRPSGKGAYRREIYFCTTCNEKEKQKSALSASISTFSKSLPARPGYMSNKRW